ncbi:MAG: carboxypeptidase regulatory-like domain-containing protein [Candidatus Thermoplasmatota archaeon]
MKSALAVAAFLLLAGCSQAPAEEPVEGASPDGAPRLSGYVVDPGIVPMKGVTLRVLDTNATATTDEGGFFAFSVVPLDQILIIIATLDGFVPISKQVSVPTDATVQLNFTLEPVAVLTPFMQVSPFTGFLSCQAAYEITGQNQTLSCDTGSTVDVWEFGVGTDLAGAVIELFWEAGSPLGQALHAKLETLNLGELNVILAETIGTSPLRLPVAQATASKYYTDGGVMRLTVRVDPNNDATEQAVGAGLAFEQQFDAFASLFYVAPPSPTYTIADA